MESVQNDSQEPGADAHLDYCLLIRTVMKQKQVTAKRLFDDHVIRRCTFRDFNRRLATGHITITELNALFVYLGIDPIRATLALSILHNADAYFDPSCETASYIAAETALVLTEQIAACEGNFEPIKQTLCRSLAQRTTGAIVEHHRRVEQVRTSAFG